MSELIGDRTLSLKPAEPQRRSGKQAAGPSHSLTVWGENRDCETEEGKAGFYLRARKKGRKAEEALRSRLSLDGVGETPHKLHPDSGLWYAKTDRAPLGSGLKLVRAAIKKLVKARA